MNLELVQILLTSSILPNFPAYSGEELCEKMGAGTEAARGKVFEDLDDLARKDLILIKAATPPQRSAPSTLQYQATLSLLQALLGQVKAGEVSSAAPGPRPEFVTCCRCDGKGEYPSVCMDDGPWPIECSRCGGTGQCPPEVHIHIAEVFTKYPGGRLRAHGVGSGEAFREDFIVPALGQNSNGGVIVDFAGVMGPGPSWIEEAFGGLVRVHHYREEVLTQRLHLRNIRKTEAVRIWEFIEDAHKVEFGPGLP